MKGGETGRKKKGKRGRKERIERKAEGRREKKKGKEDLNSAVSLNQISP